MAWPRIAPEGVPTKNLGVMVPAPTRDRLDQLAEERGVRLSVIVREALDDLLEREAAS